MISVLYNYKYLIDLLCTGNYTPGNSNYNFESVPLFELNVFKFIILINYFNYILNCMYYSVLGQFLFRLYLL